MQVWLKAPLLLQRQHAETIAFSRSSFFYFSGRRGGETPVPEVSEPQLLAMQTGMDEWFDSRRRGKATRIFAFPRADKIWFLVRHGLPIRREGKHQDDGNSAIAVYRPQQVSCS